MPQMRNGFSYWEPEGKPQPPRLFATERAAKNALTCWLQGQFRKRFETESDGWEFAPYTVAAGTEAEPVIGRKRDDMEVVRLSLVE